MSISRALMPLLVKSIALCLTPCALRHTANCNDQINEKSICYVYLLDLISKNTQCPHFAGLMANLSHDTPMSHKPL